MCGFVGFTGTDTGADIVDQMLAELHHRGPDSEGYFSDNLTGLHLAHKRLAVQDLSELGAQPMKSLCGHYVISYNGEVYNFQQIRSELILLGYNFKSNSDTEVILNSYIEWGIKCLEKFIGMFAICILDYTRKKLFLIRDRAGVKPVYYIFKDQKLIFGSELKALLKYPGAQRNINKEVLSHYFQFGYIPSPHCIFMGYKKLPPGAFLQYDWEKHDLLISKYWDISDFYSKEKLICDTSNHINEIEDLLIDSVKLRCISDVRIGVFLSGGFDSALMASILANHTEVDVECFTVGFDDELYDESEHAKNIANYLKLKHTSFNFMEANHIDLIKRFQHVFDEPFGDASALATLYLSESVKPHATVFLSADGGDEIFAGYSKYKATLRIKEINEGRLLQLPLKLALSTFGIRFFLFVNKFLPSKFRQSNLKQKLRKLRNLIGRKDFSDIFKNASSLTDIAQVRLFLSQVVEEKGDDINYISSDKDYLSQMMIADFKDFLVDDVLTKVDRSTMASSLEAREPLLDHRIAEYLAQVEASDKVKFGVPKYLEKKIVERYLPKSIMDRPKSGFTVPVESLLRNQLRDMFNSLVCAQNLDDNIFEVDMVEDMKRKFFESGAYVQELWLIFMFQVWHERWSAC